MMVPRAYLNRPVYSGLRDVRNEKQNAQGAQSAQSAQNAQKIQNTSSSFKELQRPKYQATHHPIPLPVVPAQSSAKLSSPVQIPQSRQRPHPLTTSSNGSGLEKQPPARDIAPANRTKSASALPLETLLSLTAIPPRRKPQGRKSQRLPRGDHVADFSKLLLEDVQALEVRTASSSFSNPQFDDLFGHGAEADGGWRSLADDEKADASLSVRSMSSESMPSLVVDDDVAERSLQDLTSPSPSVQRSSPDRRVRLLSASQDCGDDHPLQHVNILDPLTQIQKDTMDLPRPPKSPQTRKTKTSSLRSNLTASLRALRSAAQTVSSLATTPPMTRPDDFLTRSIFSFAPELTDDKRPPASDGPPSPALRRYLNPHPTGHEPRSPAELHSYNEYPTIRSNPASQKGSSPPPPSTAIKSIQLQTCIPSPVRSPNASSPPIWLSPNGTPITQQPDLSISAAGPNLARQREPRENAAFLRILVAEMNMRRSGKFDEAAESHASVWLPPRKAVDGQLVQSGRERWAVYTAV